MPKGKPQPPSDYEYSEKARKHGFGPPIPTEEEKKAEEQRKKEEEEKEMREIEALAE